MVFVLQAFFAENKEKLILGALQALTQKEAEKVADVSNFELEASFHTLRRLLASKSGFAAFTNLPGYLSVFELNSEKFPYFIKLLFFFGSSSYICSVFVSRSERKWWLHCTVKISRLLMQQSIC